MPKPANALAALRSGPVISRVLLIDAQNKQQLRTASKDLRDACGREVRQLGLGADSATHVTALHCLYSLLARGASCQELDLSGWRLQRLRH
jgi:hypothetical protein